MDGSIVDRARFALARPPGEGLGPYSFVSAGGAALRVWDEGSGSLALVLTPDPPNVLEHHQPTLRSLAGRVRAIGVELPGFGHSRPASSFRFSIEENVDVLLQALERMGVQRAVLMFPCLAGLIALEAARRAPERVAGVVLSQTPSFEDALAWAARVDFRGLIGTPIVGQLLVRALRHPLAKSWYRAALPKGADQGPYLEQALQAYARGADYSLASALQAIRRGTAPVDRVEVPVLSVWGDADRTHRPTDPERALTLAPRSRLVVFEGSGHFPDLERPERFEREILTFLDKEVR